MESYLNMKTIFKIDNSTYVLMLLGLLSGYIKNIFIIFIIVLIHELGHVFFFYLFNYDVESVILKVNGEEILKKFETNVSVPENPKENYCPDKERSYLCQRTTTVKEELTKNLEEN